MKVTVKLNELTFHVTVPDNATVEDLKIASLVTLPPKIEINSRTAKLWYSGRKMEFSSLLSSYGISAVSNSTVYLTSRDDALSQPSECAIEDEEEVAVEVAEVNVATETTETTESTESTPAATATLETPHKKRTKSRSKGKNRCSFGTCHAPALRMTGECQFCKGRFCSKHRLLEKHNCRGLKTCKDKSFERNALKLRSEQTVASKV